MSTSLLFVAPLLVSLPLKVNSLVGIKQAPGSLALVAGVGALLAMVGNPLFGKMSDRTGSRWGMRRPWMVAGLAGGCAGVLVVALAPSIPVVLAGWCIAQLGFNALLAAMVAVLPDQVPSVQRGLVSGVLGVCLPVASVCGTFLVKVFTGSLLAMFLGPCAVGGFFILLFALTLHDRRLASTGKPAWSLREFVRTFYVSPRKNPDFAWAFASRFMFVMAYAFLVSYQAFYLLEQIGSAQADVPQQIFAGTLAQSAVIVAASVIGGRVSDRTGRRKVFVLTASIVYGLALFVIASASGFNGFLVGMAIAGLGFGVYVAVDLALVVDVPPSTDNTARRIHIGGVTANPTGPWTVQQARNLALSCGERFEDVKFLIRDRGSNFTASFDAVFQAAGTRILRTAVQAPRMNAICERLVGTLRRELLDRLLILGEAHLRSTLAAYQVHYNTARPHQGIAQRIPNGERDGGLLTVADLDRERIHRKPVLGGLINEYSRAA